MTQQYEVLKIKQNVIIMHTFVTLRYNAKQFITKNYHIFVVNMQQGMKTCIWNGLQYRYSNQP